MANDEKIEIRLPEAAKNKIRRAAAHRAATSDGVSASMTDFVRDAAIAEATRILTGQAANPADGTEIVVKLDAETMADIKRASAASGETRAAVVAAALRRQIAADKELAY